MFPPLPSASAISNCRPDALWRCKSLLSKSCNKLQSVACFYGDIVNKLLTPTNAMQLVEKFGSVRDVWIADDLHSWLDANEIYPGIPEDFAAAQKQDEVYIVTTKQVKSAQSL